MSEFKIGDRVICTEQHEGNHSIVGEAGEIIEDYCKDVWKVRFDKEIGGHGDGGRNWNIHESKLRIVASGAGGKFKVGDIVKAIRGIGNNNVKGMVGIVREVCNEDYGVEFFGNKIIGHNLDGSFEITTGWYCDFNDIKKIEDLDAGGGYLIGDIVECTQNIDWIEKGTRGIILGSSIGVYWGDDDRGHNLSGETENGGWFSRHIPMRLIKRQAVIPSTPPDGRTVEQVVEDERETIPTTVLKKIPVIYRYIARDSDGKLFAYVDKPTRDIGGKQWYGSQFKAIDVKLFPEIKWSDDPLEIR